MEVVQSGGGVAARRPKWEVYSDDNGNMYFYNTVTGETAWELPQDGDSSSSDEDGDGHHDDLDTEPNSQVVGLTAAGDTLESNQLRDGDGNLLQLTVVRPRSSPYQIAVDVIETMLRLVDMVETEIEEQQTVHSKKKRFASPAAEIRAKKNDANKEKKRKRERLFAMTRYMNILIPPVTTASVAASVDERKPVGALFSREDARRWKLEKEVQQIRQRLATKKKKARHHVQVYARAMHEQFLKQFRIDMLKHFLSQIPYSSELQQQRILLLSSPQQVAEMELRRKATLEPEMFERYEAERRSRHDANVKNVQKVFVLADRAGDGVLHLLQVLFLIFSDERAQKYATPVRGLAELINSAEIQRFVVDYVSSRQPEQCKVSLSDFHDFVNTIEEVIEHYSSVKSAVRDAEEEIVATIEASSKGGGGGSLLRARLNMVSKKKVEQEIAALKATQQDLEMKKQRDTRAPIHDCSEALLLMMAKEDWEKHHHHRYVQVGEGLPVYCCLCRRRKWELWRQELEQQESEFRATYATRYALKIKAEELRLIGAQDGEGTQHEEQTIQDTDSPPSNNLSFQSPGEHSDAFCENFTPTCDGERIVLQIVRALVIMTERIHSEDAVMPHVVRPVHQHHYAAKQLQTGLSRRKKARKKGPRGNEQAKEEAESGLDELQMAMKVFETEDRECKLMRVEDTAMQIFLERNRRVIERPFLQHQDAAHNAYIRLVSHCVNPCSLLYRLQFERCLSFDPPQHLVMLMTDGSITGSSVDSVGRQLVLRTVPCRTEQEAASVFQQNRSAQETLKSPFVGRILSCSKHTFQLFAESGMLIQCWPVVFVVVEYFPCGSWREAFMEAISETTISSFAQAETKIVSTFRDIAAGLAAMHSGGALHLNFNLGNVFLRGSIAGYPVQAGEEIQIGGILSCKRGFDEGQLRSGDMTHCLNPVIAPPEAHDGRHVTAKADAWMLGCALYEALMMWKHHELRELGVSIVQHGSSPTTILRLKNMADVFHEIPSATSASLRSLLRMLLQPNPSQRPTMSQVVDILSFAGKRRLNV